jgi:anti-sigma B factor antagonist
MNMKIQREANALVMIPELSRIDVQTVPSFKEGALAAVEPCARIVLDLKSVQFIDSTGLGALLSLLRNVRATEGQLVLANASEQTLAMFRLVKMTKIFDLYDGVEEALDALNG